MFFQGDRTVGVRSGNVYKRLGLKWLLHARQTQRSPVVTAQIELFQSMLASAHCFPASRKFPSQH